MTAPAAGNDQPAERRQHPRRNVIDSQLVTVALPCDEAEHRGGILLDVSEGGMAVQPFVPLTPGSSSGVEFELAGAAPFKATGLVAWVGPGGRAGIRFIDVPPAAREQLRRSLGLHASERIDSAASPAADPSPDPEELDLDGALELIAERARDITAASGVAVALGDSESMTCRASTGQAPDVGAELQPEAGLSGFCLRTGELVHCPDTLADVRIDPAAAEKLNVRSILIVPVFADGRIAGLVEVLSAHPRAFEPRHLVRLQRIAELLSGAIEDSRRAESEMEPATRGAEVGQSTEPVSVTPAPEPAMEKAVAEPCRATETLNRTPAKPGNLSHEVAIENSPGRSPGSGAEQESSPAGTIESLVTACEAAVIQNPAESGAPASVAEEAARESQPEPVTEAVNAAVPLEEVPPQTTAQQVPETADAFSSSSVEEQPAEKPAACDVPAAQAVTDSVAQPPAPEAVQIKPLDFPPALRRIKNSPTRARSAKTKGRLRHIGPFYLTSPSGAGGKVVLHATVTSEGSLSNIRVVSGPRLLGNAAVNIVAQWRCQPYEPNGEHTGVEAAITIHFAPAK